MKSSKATTAARILLGLVFFVFGLNFFLHLLPEPQITGPAGAFFGGMMASGYVLQLVHATEVVAGAALLAGRFVPLALTVLAPIVVNIVAFHAFLMPPATMGVPLVILVLEVFLAWSYRPAFRSVLRAREEVTPNPRPAAPLPSAAPAE
jgi:uncharacterized membrane protein YphA (DoxX/SURF4 family)